MHSSKELNKLFQKVARSLTGVPAGYCSKIIDNMIPRFVPVLGSIKCSLSGNEERDVLVQFYLVGEDGETFSTVEDAAVLLDGLCVTRATDQTHHFVVADGIESESLEWDVCWIDSAMLQELINQRKTTLIIDSTRQENSNILHKKRQVHPQGHSFDDADFFFNPDKTPVCIYEVTKDKVVIYQTALGLKIYDHRRNAIRIAKDAAFKAVRSMIRRPDHIYGLLTQNIEMLLSFASPNNDCTSLVRSNMRYLGEYWFPCNYLDFHFCKIEKRIGYTNCWNECDSNFDFKLVSIDPKRIILKDK